MSIEQPGHRPPAPDELIVVQKFVNSVNREFGPDRFETTESMSHWISRHGLPGHSDGRPDELLRKEVVDLREALRDLLHENAGAPMATSAREAIARLSKDHPLVVHPGRGAGALELAARDPGLSGLIATVIGMVYTSMSAGTWKRLKACQEDVCGWAFYDRSPARSGRWCSMQVCGARAKMRTYRSPEA